MHRSGTALGALLVAFLAASPLSAAGAPAPRPAPRGSATEEPFVYTVRRGDTLFDLARRYLRHAEDWKPVRTLNRVADPRRLRPDSHLRIPFALLKTEPLSARVAAFRGDARLIRDGRPTPAAVGTPVAPGTTLETGAGGFLSLLLSNGSRLTLPSQTRLRVTTMRRIVLTNSVDFDFMVEKGRVETRVTPLPTPQSRYRIRTPIAVSAVRGTTFRVHYDGANAPSLTEVLEGTVGVGAATATADALIPVEHGFGAGVDAQGTTRREALLPPPELQNPGKVQVDPLVSLALTPMANARAYRVQLARDAGFVDLAQEETAATPELRLAGVANGRWFVRATALSPSGMEGLSQTYSLLRKLTGIAATSEKTDTGYRFRWAGEGEGTRVYRFVLRPETPGGAPLVDEPGLSTDTLTLSDLRPGRYFWRVGVRQYDADGETANWTPEQSLIVAAPEPAPARSHAPAPTPAAR